MALLQVNLFSKTLRRNMPVTILMPTDNCSYAGNYVAPEGPVKTLYLLNGLEGNNMDWFMFGDIIELSRKYRIAIVCPSGENKFYVNNSSTGEDYGYYVAVELVEQTRRMLNLSRRREDTFLAGVSMGGYGALRNGLKYCGNFGYVAALSPFILDENYEKWFGDRSLEGSLFDNSPRLMRAILGDRETMLENDTDLCALLFKQFESGRNLPKLYISCVDDETAINEGITRFCSILKENKADYILEESSEPDFVDYCRKYLTRAIRFFFPVNINGLS